MRRCTVGDDLYPRISRLIRQRHTHRQFRIDEYRWTRRHSTVVDNLRRARALLELSADDRRSHAPAVLHDERLTRHTRKVRRVENYWSGRAIEQNRCAIIGIAGLLIASVVINLRRI